MGSTGRPSRSSTCRCRTRPPGRRMDRRLPPLGRIRGGGMSEYQYYEFVALDRPLIGKQRAELRSLSACAEITVTRFVKISQTESGVVAICVHGKHRQAIPILDLPLPDPPPQGVEWIAAYRRWAG